MEADGLLAVCIQHEMDHLEGKLFVDYLSEIKRSRIRKRLERDRRQTFRRGISGSGRRARPRLRHVASKPRVLFAGTPAFAVASLAALVDRGIGRSRS